jgi:hypothetical protein
MFDFLQKEQMIQSISMVLEAANSDSAPSVRNAACRALGIYILFPCVYGDSIFLKDTVTCLVNILLNDSNLSVRIRTSWAFANLCDAIAKISLPEEIAPSLFDAPPKETLVDNSTLFTLLKVALKVSGLDSDKVPPAHRSNVTC